MTQKQSGNILFLILIAVALFAALSYAVTGSSRTGTDSISKDKAKILAAEIIQYATQVEQGVSRLRVINNVPEYGMDFAAAGYSGNPSNTGCTSNNCKVFHSDGAAVPKKLIPDGAWNMQDNTMLNTWKGKMWYQVMQIQNVGSDLPELVMQFPGLNEDTCRALNERLGIQAVNIIDSYGTSGTHFTGYTGNLTSFPSTSAVSLGDEVPAFSGKRSFCTRESVAGSFHYWHVLLER
jgi:hypothetical protein